MNKDTKIIVLFKSAPGTPELATNKFGFSQSHTVQVALNKLRKGLSLSNETPLFIFVNNTFSPSSDRTFGQLGQLYGKYDPVKNICKINMLCSTVEAWG